MEESFGVVKIISSHPYYKDFSQYVSIDYHMTGVYYPSVNGVGFMLYDSYTGLEIKNVDIGDVLMCNLIDEVRTTKYSFIDDSLRESFLSHVMTERDDCKTLIRKCLLSGNCETSFIDPYIHRLGVETIYRRETDGIVCTSIKNALDALHFTLFEVKREISLEGISFTSNQVVKVNTEEDYIKRIFIQSLNQRKTVVELSRDEIDLGDESFETVMIVRYKSENGKDITTKTRDSIISINNNTSDLTFVETTTLQKLLRYIVESKSASFKTLERSILSELSRRQYFY